MHSVKYIKDPFTEENNSVEIIFKEGSNEKTIAPCNPANRHYAAILEWVADGNTIEEAD
jgi:hypothetical protein